MISAFQPGDPSDDAGLVRRVRAGDREAAAEFFARHRDVLRQRIRQRLRRSGRRLFDSQDILSTVSRRLDHLVRQHGVRASSAAELMRLVIEIASNSVVDKARVIDRIDRAEGSDSRFAQRLRSRIDELDRHEAGRGEEVIAHVLERLPSEGERQVMALWLRGWTLDSIAEEFHTKPAAMRKRWQSIRSKSLAILANGDMA